MPVLKKMPLRNCQAITFPHRWWWAFLKDPPVLVPAAAASLVSGSSGISENALI